MNIFLILFIIFILIFILTYIFLVSLICKYYNCTVKDLIGKFTKGDNNE